MEIYAATKHPIVRYDLKIRRNPFSLFHQQRRKIPLFARICPHPMLFLSVHLPSVCIFHSDLPGVGSETRSLSRARRILFPSVRKSTPQRSCSRCDATFVNAIAMSRNERIIGIRFASRSWKKDPSAWRMESQRCWIIGYREGRPSRRFQRNPAE